MLLPRSVTLKQWVIRVGAGASLAGMFACLVLSCQPDHSDVDLMSEEHSKLPTYIDISPNRGVGAIVDASRFVLVSELTLNGTELVIAGNGVSTYHRLGYFAYDYAGQLVEVVSPISWDVENVEFIDDRIKVVSVMSDGVRVRSLISLTDSELIYCFLK
jgi:hypothetical protein